MQANRNYRRTLAVLVDPDRFPEAAALFASPLFESPPDGDTDSADQDFVFALELILNGVAAEIDGA